MVIQKPTSQFLGKVNQFSKDKTTPERQRSGVVHSTFRHRSDVVQMTVQAGSIETILSCLKKAFRTRSMPKKYLSTWGFLWVFRKSS